MTGTKNKAIVALIVLACLGMVGQRFARTYKKFMKETHHEKVN